jgi:hypothetical protein
VGKDFLCCLYGQESHRHGQQGRDEELHGGFRGSRARNGEESRRCRMGVELCNQSATMQV